MIRRSSMRDHNLICASVRERNEKVSRKDKRIARRISKFQLRWSVFSRGIISFCCKVHIGINIENVVQSIAWLLYSLLFSARSCFRECFSFLMQQRSCHGNIRKVDAWEASGNGGATIGNLLFIYLFIYCHLWNINHLSSQQLHSAFFVLEYI